MKKVNLLIAPAAAAFFATGAFATGELIEIDVTGWTAGGAIGDPDNTTLSLDLNSIFGAAGAQGGTITGFGWDVTIQTVGASWQSEATFEVGDSIGDAANILVSPGATQGTPGTGTFSSDGILKLSDVGLDDIVIADGIVEIELFDSFDDAPGVDAFVDGTFIIQFQPVPAPAALGLLGVAGFAARRRRRG